MSISAVHRQGTSSGLIVKNKPFPDMVFEIWRCVLYLGALALAIEEMELLKLHISLFCSNIVYCISLEIRNVPRKL